MKTLPRPYVSPLLTERDRLAESAPISFGEVRAAYPDLDVNNGPLCDVFMLLWADLRYQYADAMIETRMEKTK